MKKVTSVLLLSVSLLSGAANAAGLLSDFALVEGDVSECPLRLSVTRTGNTLKMHMINSAEMNGVGVFSNSVMYFDNINAGRIVTEKSGVGTFSTKTDLEGSGSKVVLSEDEMFENNGKVLRHTRVSLSVNVDNEATLSYNIITLKKKQTAESYTSFVCAYKVK